MVRTGPPAQDQLNFVRTSKFQFFLELNENKLKNLIWTSKLKFSFRDCYLEKMEECTLHRTWMSPLPAQTNRFFWQSKGHNSRIESG